MGLHFVSVCPTGFIAMEILCKFYDSDIFNLDECLFVINKRHGACLIEFIHYISESGILENEYGDKLRNFRQQSDYVDAAREAIESSICNIDLVGEETYK